MRRAAKVDQNHGEIVAALIARGWLVLSLASMGRGVPDLLVWHPRSGFDLVEVKMPTGALTDDQRAFAAKGWPVMILRSERDVTAWAAAALGF